MEQRTVESSFPPPPLYLHEFYIVISVPAAEASYLLQVRLKFHTSLQPGMGLHTHHSVAIMELTPLQTFCL